MSLRKVGTCKLCSEPLYGDNYGPAGHYCRVWERQKNDAMVWLKQSESEHARIILAILEERRS